MTAPITVDRVRESRAERQNFAIVRRAEIDYARKLRQVAANVGRFIRALFPGGEPAHPGALSDVHRVMRGYAEILRPWATVTASRMIADVSRRDLMAWKRHGDKIGRAMRREVTETPIGDVVQARLAAQVALITSLPTEAAERVHKLTLERLTTGGRAKGIAKEIMQSGHVTESRATLIARTEVGRTATDFTRARAEAVGSTHFQWQTAQDADVRKVHKHLQGSIHRWDDPPVAGENGERYLPGAGPNCRCWPTPIIPDTIT